MFKMTELRNLNITATNGLKLSYIAHLGLHRGESQPLVTHNITEIMVVKCGKGEFFSDDEVYSVLEGDVFVVNADTVHAEKALSDNFEVYIIGVENYSIHVGLKTPTLIENNMLSHYSKQILLETERNGEYLKENVTMLFSLIVNTVLEIMGKQLKINVKCSGNEVVNLVKKYLDEHYLESVSIDMLAKKFIVNKYTLMHNFKQKTGSSIVDYVLKKRLVESENWLKISTLSIKEVADRCAFSNPSYFTEYFKKEYGVTPTEYRNYLS